MDNIRTYSSESVIRRPRVLLRELFRDIRQSRELAWRLSVRDIKALYRQSFFGILWAFILPLGNTITWLFLRNTGIVAVAETPIPYPVYVFTGTMLWAIVTESLTGPLLKVQGARSMLTKINFPREAVILSSVFQTMFNAGVKILLIFAGMLILGYAPSGWPLVLFPVGILSLILAGTSIGLMLTPIGMLYTDIGKGLTIVMQFLMYATPVVFPIPKEGWIAEFISYNPFTPLIMTARDWLTGQHGMFVQEFMWVNIVFFFVLLFGMLLYRIAMPFLIERMSS